MNEYPFDPFNQQPQEGTTPTPPAAEPMPPAEPTPPAEPVPTMWNTPENPPEPEFKPYTPPEEPSPLWQRMAQLEPLPPKGEQPVTTRRFYVGIALALIFSLLLGLAGGFAGARLFGGNTVVPEGTAVIYKTEKLQGTDSAMTVEQVAQLVKPSVVAITTEQVVTGSFMQQYISEGAGSGVIITADGYVVTNHHVIDGATNIRVTLYDGTGHTATLVGTDAKADLAVLKIDATGLTPAPYGKAEELQLAETVIAVGNPLGELAGTVTSGILSALDREIAIDNTTMRLLQTDTAINPGNSGGGLFNTSGQLIGVVNAKSAGEEIEGLGFAIPIDTVEKVVEDLMTHGYVTGRVEPGFTYVEIKDAMTAMMYRVNELGLYISKVEQGSDGDTAGFKSGDYVVSIDGTKVATAAQATAIIDKKAVGDTATFVVKRSGNELTLTLTLTEYVPTVADADKGNTNAFQNPWL